MKGAERGTPPDGHGIEIKDYQVYCGCGWVMKTGLEGPNYVNGLIDSHIRAVLQEKRA